MHIDKKDNLYLESFLKDGIGTVFYSVTPTCLKEYLQSKITLTEVYKLSNSFLVSFKYRTRLKTYLKEDFSDSLESGADYYKDIPTSMKSEEIKNKF